MKVLWVTNVPPQNIGSIKGYGGGGWIAGAHESISRQKDMQITITYPLLGTHAIQKESHGNTVLIGFPQKPIMNSIPLPRRKLSKFEKDTIKKIIDEVNPDILHVFGTESLHSRVFIEFFGKPEKTVIHIQGMVSMIAKHCQTGFPFWARHLIVPSSLFWGTISSKQRELAKAGTNEVATIRQVKYIMGRTEWDEACTKAINPNVQYLHCGESLRTSFYEESAKWNVDYCNKHTIYFSQSSKQIKGLHLVLPGLAKLINKYSDVHIFVGGNAPVKVGSWKECIQMSPLGFYLYHLIKKYHLQHHITFLGPQSEKQVVENLKKAHVFLSASLIENSPNSVGEALMIGTPVVSSDVGGVKNFITHGQNGYLFPIDEPYMIAYYIDKLFDNDRLAERLCEAGRASARDLYSRSDNGENLISLYKVMMD